MQAWSIMPEAKYDRHSKQFDGFTWLTLTPYFTTIPRHWCVVSTFSSFLKARIGWMGWLPWRRECADRVDGQHFAAVWDRALPVWSHVDRQRCVRLFCRRAAPPSMMTITVINERCRRPVTSLKSGARGSSAQRRPRAIRPAPRHRKCVCGCGGRGRARALGSVLRLRSTLRSQHPV